MGTEVIDAVSAERSTEEISEAEAAYRLIQSMREEIIRHVSPTYTLDSLVDSPPTLISAEDRCYSIQWQRLFLGEEAGLDPVMRDEIIVTCPQTQTSLTVYSVYEQSLDHINPSFFRGGEIAGGSGSEVTLEEPISHVIEASFMPLLPLTHTLAVRLGI